MATEDELHSKIEELEKKKNELIEGIKQVYRKIRYKKYKQTALGPFLEQTKDVRITPLRKQRRVIEFKISTAAYTPQMEKNLLKELKKIDEELGKVKEVEKARRMIKYVEQDIKDGEAEIVKIEGELKVIREELKKLYDQMKAIRGSAMPPKRYQNNEPREDNDMVSLGDVALIEKEEN
ncbi:MAG: hypothetical protein ACP5N9_07030 [Candidatus Bilamarchaeum sp.]|jgi:uncharacterized coiled-coil DUF342 family protein